MADDKKPASTTPAVPDPDEDDLDELDDVLDQFQNTKLAKDTPAASASTKPDSSGPGRPKDAEAKADGDAAAPEEADFAKQLETGMQEMLRELESNPEMAKQFEDMMRQFGPPPGSDLSELADEAKKNTTLPEPSPSATKSPPAGADKGAPEPNFQDTIRRTLDRMQHSNESADAATASKGGSEDDIMSALLQEIANNGGGEGGDDSFSNMLLGMMEQLTNKDILYEPMKDLNNKFPEWLAERKEGGPKADSLSAEDRKRYEEQSGFVKEIVERFEKDGYSDKNAQDREYIVDRMQKMQAAGAPPQELVGDMGAASDMLGDVENGCPQQ